MHCRILGPVITVFNVILLLYQLQELDESRNVSIETIFCAEIEETTLRQLALHLKEHAGHPFLIPVV